jgi:predicted aspartyl protease
MTITRFPYKKIRGIYQPLIPIGVQFDSLWLPLEVYIDSGAEYTVIEARIAHSVGFNYRQGKRIYLKVGNGSLMTVYLNRLNIQLGKNCLPCDVGFSEQLNVNYNILGKVDIFEQFKICFSQSNRVITFEKVS